MRRRSPAVAALALLGVVALGGSALAQSPDASEAPAGSPAASEAPAGSPAASVAVPSLSPECASPENLPLKTPGQLTLSTDNPAYPPWWGGTPPEGSEWTLGYPPSGEGYEGATAYAVASALGFEPDQVVWIANAVFENAFAPGDKPFDYHLAQISIRPERAEAVDFSDPYFDANQSILALTPNPISEVTTIEGLKEFRLGAATGTTSFQLIESVIQPNAEASVFNDNSAALQALQNEQVDGIVVDLQTAFFMRDAQLENFDTPEPEATVVGQFDESAQVDQMGIVLELGSALTPCVNEALAIITANGTLDAIYEEWISAGQDIPFFQ
jgi:polar amino acid transport system substrate-binding protein